MSHAPRADKLLIKPAAGARPAPPRTRGQIIPKARTKRPVTRRVTRDTAATRLAWSKTDHTAESYRHPTSRTMSFRPSKHVRARMARREPAIQRRLRYQAAAAVASTARRMSSVAASGWETNETCEAGTSTIVAFARSAMNR